MRIKYCDSCNMPIKPKVEKEGDYLENEKNVYASPIWDYCNSMLTTDKQSENNNTPYSLNGDICENCIKEFDLLFKAWHKDRTKRVKMLLEKFTI